MARRLVGRLYRSSSLSTHSITARAVWLAHQGRLGVVPARADHQLRVRTAPSIPRLAWLAEVADGRHAVTVGRGVEQHARGFFEGVWDGPFDRFEPDRTGFAFGTGAVVRRGRVRFVPSRQTTEFVYVLRDVAHDRALVSNSLAFVLEAGDVAHDSALFAGIAERLRDVTDHQNLVGIDRARPLVVAADGLELHQIAYHPFEVDRRGRPRMIWTPPRRHFTTYAEYKAFLTTTTGRLVANAVDPERTFPLPPITTVSKGYDSAATSAVAAACGCRDALTLAVSVYGNDDCGAEVAEHLGLEVRIRSHVAGEDLDALDFAFDDALSRRAAEFLATSGLGDDITFLPFEADLEQRLLFSGKVGDGVWPREPTARSGLPVMIPFGKSYTEFRLRQGFAHVALPCLGTRFMPPVAALSASPEMAPWSVGGAYDRPLARRLAEEAGVPRNLFGLAKTATSPRPLNQPELFPGAMAVTRGRYRNWQAHVSADG